MILCTFTLGVVVAYRRLCKQQGNRKPHYNNPLAATDMDIPEILEFKLKWVAAKHGGAVEFFKRLGLDTTDVVTRSVVRGMLSTLIGDHFQFRYVWEHILKSPKQSKFAQEHNMQEPMQKFDDAYYKQYADILATLYFHGLHGIAKMQRKKKSRKGGKDA